VLAWVLAAALAAQAPDKHFMWSVRDARGGVAHLVEVAVAPAERRQGHAHRLLGASVEPFVALGMMLGFGEAFLTGMLVTILVVYRRDWVVTFDDARWLAPRA